MSCPKELLYTKSHEWLRVDEGNVTVGITDHAQKELADIVFVELPEAGRKVAREEAVAVVESVKTASDIYSPADGEIVEINSELADRPELVNEDPYGKGWMFKLKISSKIDKAFYLDADAYEKTVAGGGHH